jgi:peptidoglycan/LPS O-acetylase OafA/YrhL
MGKPKYDHSAVRSTEPQTSRVEVLYPLRGIAALAVTWYHFSGRYPNSIVKMSGAYGYLGVEVFFVISGFVIPYALGQARYKVRDYGRFCLKRVLRLVPPYLFSILFMLLIISVRAALHGFQGTEMEHISATQILSHVGYVTEFFGYQWLLPVYWTLAIEFQFYLSIGLLYPLISNRSQWIRNTTLVCLGLTFLISRSDAFISHHVFLFLLGIITYQYRKGLLSGKFYGCALLLVLVGLLISLGLAITLAGVSTALAIAFLDTSGGPLKFFGKISYSLYLTHAIIGSTILDFSQHRVNGTIAMISLYLAVLAISIFSAYLLYRLVELPAQRWSARITYGRKPEKAVVPGMIDVESL